MWKIKPTAVYYTIVDEDDKLICFMGISEKDYQKARLICNKVNGVPDHPSCQTCGLGVSEGEKVFDGDILFHENCHKQEFGI